MTVKKGDRLIDVWTGKISAKLIKVMNIAMLLKRACILKNL